MKITRGLIEDCEKYRQALQQIRDITSSAYSTPNHALALDLLRTINTISANAIRRDDANKT